MQMHAWKFQGENAPLPSDKIILHISFIVCGGVNMFNTLSEPVNKYFKKYQEASKIRKLRDMEQEKRRERKKTTKRKKYYK